VLASRFAAFVTTIPVLGEDGLLIEFTSVFKAYPDGTHAVDGLSLHVARGEIFVLIGPSGCGKTTTLRMINRLIEPTSGRILVNGSDVLEVDPIELRRSIGYAIQEVALFPHMTVAENISIVPGLQGWSAARQRSRVLELLELVGLKPDRYRAKYPHELSGGERQRIGVARAMGADPPVMLMDEPFGAIDPITRTRLQDEFLSIQAKIQKTVVFVTHDINEALKMGDHIAIMRRGKLVQCGTSREILSRPNCGFVEEFVGADRLMKLLQILRVSELMTRDLPTVVIDEKPQAILPRPSVKGLNLVLVVDRLGRLKGFVPSTELLKNVARPLAHFLTPVRESVSSNASLAEALLRLSVNGLDFLPVVDGDQRLQGVLTLVSVHEEIQKTTSRAVA